MTSTTSLQCAATTRAGTRCARNATIEGYCRQHYDMLAIPLIPDITKEVLSGYIEYDQLIELQDKIKDLKIDPARIVQRRTESKDGSYTIETTIDKVLRKTEKYNVHNTKITEEQDYGSNGQLEGIGREWYASGTKKLESTYVDGKLEGIRRTWYGNGNIDSITVWKDGTKDGAEVIFKEYINKHISYINIWSMGTLIKTIENLSVSQMSSILSALEI